MLAKIRKPDGEDIDIKLDKIDHLPTFDNAMPSSQEVYKPSEKPVSPVKPVKKEEKPKKEIKDLQPEYFHKPEKKIEAKATESKDVATKPEVKKEAEDQF